MPTWVTGSELGMGRPDDEVPVQQQGPSPYLVRAYRRACLHFMKMRYLAEKELEGILKRKTIFWIWAAQEMLGALGGRA